MSSMLDQAIIDAEQLKEAAQQNAEEVIIEKYQDEIRNAVETILEQEEEVPGMEGIEDPPAALEVTDEGDLAFVEELPPTQKSDMDEVVPIDLDKLEEMMAEEMAEKGLDPAELVNREQVAEDINDALNEEDEEISLDEETLKDILSELIEEDNAYLDPDVKDEEEGRAAEEEAEKAGGQTGAVYKGVSESSDEGDADLTEDAAEEEAQEGKSRDKDDGPGAGGGYKRGYKKKPAKDRPFQENLNKENKALLREQKKTAKQVQLLEEKLHGYGTIITKLKDKLEEGNLVNARLLYQNRVLNSISLNERQKDRIVEAISNAKTVEEAKIIFETLQSAVGSASKKTRPESLNEVVTRSSSAFIPRKEEKRTTRDDSFAERMRILAGIKNN